MANLQELKANINGDRSNARGFTCLFLLLLAILMSKLLHFVLKQFY
jgi:hypothetical protein